MALAQVNNKEIDLDAPRVGDWDTSPGRTLPTFPRGTGRVDRKGKYLGDASAARMLQVGSRRRMPVAKHGSCGADMPRVAASDGLCGGKAWVMWLTGSGT